MPSRLGSLNLSIQQASVGDFYPQGDLTLSQGKTLKVGSTIVVDTDGLIPYSSLKGSPSAVTWASLTGVPATLMYNDQANSTTGLLTAVGLTSQGAGNINTQGTGAHQVAGVTVIDSSKNFVVWGQTGQASVKCPAIFLSTGSSSECVYAGDATMLDPANVLSKSTLGSRTGTCTRVRCSGGATNSITFESSSQVLAEVAGDTGRLLCRGGICPQQGVDGGAACGIRLWHYSDSSWGVYVAQAGANKALSGTTASCQSIDGRTQHALRFRVSNSAAYSFIWENSSETCLMSLASDTGNLSVYGDITAFASTSDARFKDNVEVLPPMLRRIERLRPVSFTWNSSCPNVAKVGAASTGLIAQEVEAVFPELVEEAPHKIVRYEKLITYLVKAVQELSAEVKALRRTGTA